MRGGFSAARILECATSRYWIRKETQTKFFFPLPPHVSPTNAMLDHYGKRKSHDRIPPPIGGPASTTFVRFGVRPSG